MGRASGRKAAGSVGQELSPVPPGSNRRPRNIQSKPRLSLQPAEPVLLPSPAQSCAGTDGGRPVPEMPAAVRRHPGWLQSSSLARCYKRHFLELSDVQTTGRAGRMKADRLQAAPFHLSLQATAYFSSL